MREQSLFYQNESGGILRSGTPYGAMRHTTQRVAFDGQCGEILAAYREHLCSADRSWLEKVWPRIREAMEYVIVTWDKDEAPWAPRSVPGGTCGDGVLAGLRKFSICDCRLPIENRKSEIGNAARGTLYLAALGASEKMALLQGQPNLASRYRRIRLAGENPYGTP